LDSDEGESFCLLFLSPTCTTGNTDLFQEKSTVNTSKWDYEATDKNYHQPQPYVVKKSLLVTLCSRRRSGLLLFQIQAGYPITFLHSEAQQQKKIVVCMEGRFFFTPRLPAPSPDLLEVLHAPQVQAHSWKNTK